MVVIRLFQHNDKLRIRPPQTGESEIKQWSHQPEVLVNGSCLYKVMVCDLSRVCITLNGSVLVSMC